MQGFTHVYDPETDAYWQAPDGLVEQLVEGGLQVVAEPLEPNPAVEEQAAAREEAAKRAAEEAAAERAATKTTKSARRGEPQED